MRRRVAIDYEDAFQNWKQTARHGEGRDAIVLDLGQGNMNVLYAKIGAAGELSVLDYASAPGTGFSDGAITDAGLFAHTLDRTVGQIRKRNRIKLRNLDVTFSAPFVGYFTHYATVHLPPRKRVTLKLIDEAIRSARAEISSLVEHVIQVVPVRYTLDAVYSGSEAPLGMGGGQLGVEILFITAPEASLGQIERALGEVGYGVANWWYSGISAAESVVVPSSEAGVAVVDIGAGSTDIAVYQFGRLLHIGVLPRGGREIDHDLAVYLNESIAVAEEVKRSFGCALPQVIKYNEVIDLRERGLGSNKLVPAREIAAVIKNRAQELLYAVGEEIGKALPQNQISRVILTGGSARIAGLPELAELVLDRCIEVGIPCAVPGTKMGFTDPACAALIGTLKVLRKKQLSLALLDHAAMTTTQRMKIWFEALFSTPVAEQREIV